ncbi:unnamed protein product [Rhizophagus irregularis]|nr:unnamed protein product [Rhizophagus irregularis]
MIFFIPRLIEWKSQLRFAKEIASAILYLHDVKAGNSARDLCSNNTIKLADSGQSFKKGKGCDNTEVWSNTLRGS